MVKKYFFVLLIITVTFFGLSGCNKQDKDKYHWQGHKWEDMISLFEEQKSMFVEIADILVKNDSFWAQYHDQDDLSAWIMSPNDDKKMRTFSVDEQESITRFFEKTNPYQITVDNKESVTITYINEEKTGGFQLTYCYDYLPSYDEWISYNKSKYPEFLELGDNWYIYRK